MMDDDAMTSSTNSEDATRTEDVPATRDVGQNKLLSQQLVYARVRTQNHSFMIWYLCYDTDVGMV